MNVLLQPIGWLCVYKYVRATRYTRILQIYRQLFIIFRAPRTEMVI